MTSRRRRNQFLTGAAVGAGATIGTLLLINIIGRSRHPRVIRLQKSLQIGRPVERVFNAWADLEHLKDWSDVIRTVTRSGNHSHWAVNIGGRQLEWDAEVEQFIPNQSIGWKSLNGPKHTGRISFSPLGEDTVIHVTMNYAPPLALLRPFVTPFTGQIEGYLDQVLRDFKAAMENAPAHHTRAGLSGTHLQSTAGSSRATGTFGAAAENVGRSERPRYGGSPSAPEYTPPESKS